jgi:uncharacterized C2H2 Zn-finger protein
MIKRDTRLVLRCSICAFVWRRVNESSTNYQKHAQIWTITIAKEHSSM